MTTAFTERRYKMIEAAADAVVAAIFKRFAIAETIRVEIRKPSAPIEAIFAYTAIVIERNRTA